MARECRECGTIAKFNDRRCSNCGASVFDTVKDFEAKNHVSDAERTAWLERCKLEQTKKSNQWLISQAIINGQMTAPERMKCLSKYRDRIQNQCKRGGREWANDLLNREEDGEILQYAVKKMARLVAYSPPPTDEEMDFSDIPTDF